MSACGDCNRNLSDDDRWSIPASILTTLWSDVYPRLIAERWLQQPPDSDWIGVNKVQLAALTLTLKDGSTSEEFHRRADRTAEYLLQDRSIPIWVVGKVIAGGFDFILSDLGLELFVPPKPTQEELVRYYMYRSTGRRANGLPSYLDGSIAGVSTDAPTGPSQVILDYDVLKDLLTQDGATIRASCVGEVLHCLEPYRSDDAHDTVTRISALEPLKSRLTLDDLEAWRQEGLIHDMLLKPVEQHKSLYRGLTVDTYAGTIERARCWYVSGAVYRGIMVELPRVVATCWHEFLEIDAASDRLECVRFFGPPGPTDKGLRQIFRERLETSLHDVTRMKFEAYKSGVGPQQLRAEGVWADDDVNITNRGFYIPTPKDPRTFGTPGDNVTPATTPLEEMLTAIRDGKAGNPVFTDSAEST